MVCYVCVVVIIEFFNYYTGNYNEFNSTTVVVDEAYVGSNVQLICSTMGPPVYSIRWMKDGSDLISPSCKYSISSSRPDTSILTVYNLSVNDVGVYRCTAYSYYTVNSFTSQVTLTITGN